MSFSPYDPYVPFEPSFDLLRRDAILRAGGRIPAEDDALYRVVDGGSGAVVAEGSRNACLDRVLDAWWQTTWVPVGSRPRAQAAALRLRFERWDDRRCAWLQAGIVTDAIVAQHAPI